MFYQFSDLRKKFDREGVGLSLDSLSSFLKLIVLGAYISTYGYMEQPVFELERIVDWGCSGSIQHYTLESKLLLVNFYFGLPQF